MLCLFAIGLTKLSEVDRAGVYKTTSVSAYIKNAVNIHRISEKEGKKTDEIIEKYRNNRLIGALFKKIAFNELF